MITWTSVFMREASGASKFSQCFTDAEFSPNIQPLLNGDMSVLILNNND
jgi:hypothetical protein